MKILLTGATGFLGSHIAEVLVVKGNELLLTKRISSDLWRCDSFKNIVSWINTDSSSWLVDVQHFNPDIIINSAWDGVSAANRDEWSAQVKNIAFQQQLLEVSKLVNLKKFISIGSQAEYGEFSGCIDENYPTNPTSAYGATKLAASVILKTFCEQNIIKWYWFRLFSCFGERESENWLIPATIKNMLTHESMDLTPGEQQYSYLYVKDIADLIASAIDSDAENGIYNIASTQRRSLIEILSMIKEYLNPSFKLNFGVLPYRTNQSMINGSFMEKTSRAFGNIDCNNFREKLFQTIEYYRRIFNE